MSSHRFFAAATFALALAVPAAAFAQTSPAPSGPPGSQVQPLGPGAYGIHGHKRHHGHHRHGMMGMMRNLNLSAAQKQQIAAIRRQAHQQNQNVTDPAVRRANGQRVRQQIDAVLTPAQRTQMQQQIQQMRAHRRAAPGGPSAPAQAPGQPG